MILMASMMSMIKLSGSFFISFHVNRPYLVVNKVYYWNCTPKGSTSAFFFLVSDMDFARKRRFYILGVGGGTWKSFNFHH